MTKEVTLRQAGGSVSATLPKDMADRLRLEAGDRVLAIETDRGILLTPYNPDTERALRIAAGRRRGTQRPPRTREVTHGPAPDRAPLASAGCRGRHSQ